MTAPAVPGSEPDAAAERPGWLGVPLAFRECGAGMGRRRTLLTLAGLLLATAQPVVADLPGTAQLVSIEHERLRLDVDAMPLSQLLASLDRDGPVAIRLRGEPSSIRISATFEGVGLLEALRRLLADHSHILVHLGAVDDARPILEVILLGRMAERHPLPGEAGRIAVAGAPTPDRSPASVTGAQRLEERPVEELIHMAKSAGPASSRAAALDALAYAAAGNENAAAYAVLEQALSDPDRRVRARAMATLKDAAEELPVDSLARLVREDPQPRLRARALELLVERSDEQAHGPLRTALVDPDPIVHGRARELIEDLHIELDGH